MQNNVQNDKAAIGRPLTVAEIDGISGGETKAQAVAHANAVADAMIAILKKYGLA